MLKFDGLDLFSAAVSASASPSGEISRHSRFKICRLKKVVPVRFRPRAPPFDMSLQKRIPPLALQMSLIGLALGFGIAKAETMAFTCVRSNGAYSEEYELKIVSANPKNPKDKAKVFLDGRDLDQHDAQGYQEIKNVQITKSAVSFMTDTFFEPEILDGVKYASGTVVAITSIQRDTGQLKKVETVTGGILAKTLGEGTKVYTEQCQAVLNPAP